MAMLSSSFRKMWPTHLHILAVCKTPMLVCLVNLRSKIFIGDFWRTEYLHGVSKASCIEC